MILVLRVPRAPPVLRVILVLRVPRAPPVLKVLRVILVPPVLIPPCLDRRDPLDRRVIPVLKVPLDRRAILVHRDPLDRRAILVRPVTTSQPPTRA